MTTNHPTPPPAWNACGCYLQNNMSAAPGDTNPLSPTRTILKRCGLHAAADDLLDACAALYKALLYGGDRNTAARLASAAMEKARGN